MCAALVHSEHAQHAVGHLVGKGRRGPGRAAHRHRILCRYYRCRPRTPYRVCRHSDVNERRGGLSVGGNALSGPRPAAVLGRAGQGPPNSPVFILPAGSNSRRFAVFSVHTASDVCIRRRLCRFLSESAEIAALIGPRRYRWRVLPKAPRPRIAVRRPVSRGRLPGGPGRRRSGSRPLPPCRRGCRRACPCSAG